jgi:hypothetical protein
MMSDTMSEQSIQAHFTYNLQSARVRPWPFPHVYYENVFPADFYASLVETMQDPEDFTPIAAHGNVKRFDGTTAYPDRYVALLDEETEGLSPEWNTATKVFRSLETRSAMLDKFIDVVRPRLYKNPELGVDLQLIRDKTDYALGPHTDHPRRYVVLLVYLPKTDENPHLGTSLYIPDDDHPGFSCPGGPHYDRTAFTCAFTAPYKPNTAVAFVKTDNSFHGVEPVLKGEERNLVQIFVKNVDD